VYSYPIFHTCSPDGLFHFTFSLPLVDADFAVMIGTWKSMATATPLPRYLDLLAGMTDQLAMFVAGIKKPWVSMALSSLAMRSV
jgi:hypothetical protein